MDAGLYVRVVLSLLVVIGLMMGALWALRRFGLGGMVPRNTGRRRLSVVETLSLDAKHRLVLVRRDDTEHLLLVGGGSDLVVEQGIAPVAAVSGENAQ